MRGIPAAAAALGLVACIIKPYRMVATGDEQPGDVTGETRSVPVGVRYEASIVPGTDFSIQVTEHKVCRNAIFGTRPISRYMEHVDRKWMEYPMLAIGYLGTPAGITGTVLGASWGLPLLIIGGGMLIEDFYWGIKEKNADDVRVVRHDKATAWNGDVADCPGVEGGPAAGRHVSISGQSAQANWHYTYDDVVTNDQGIAQIGGVLSRAQRIATMCPDATLVVTDDTPGAVTDPGAPDNVMTVSMPFAQIMQPVGAAGPASFDGLAGGELQTAQICYQQKVNVCKATEAPNVTPSCEESCAKAQGTTDCLLDWRRAMLKIDPSNAQSKAQVDNLRRECQVRKGGSPDDEAACFQKCVDDKTAERCK